MLKLIEKNLLLNWLHQADDAEWRPDYECFFILKGSKTHSWLALQDEKIFD